MEILCNFITKPIKDLAILLGKQDSVTANIVSAWQTTNLLSSIIPTKKQVLEFLKENLLLDKLLYLAIPFYEATDEFNPKIGAISISSENKIVLNRLPKLGTLEKFFEYEKNNPYIEDLKKVITNPKEAYLYSLWKAMAYIQKGIDIKDFNNSKVNEEALKKATSYHLFNSKNNTVTIEYTPKGKPRLTYTIIGNHIYNKDGKEVFKENSRDSNKIFANLAVLEKRAVVVEYKNAKYVVNNKGVIISVTSGDIMNWGDENGNRKAILEEALKKFNNLKSPLQVKENTNSNKTNIIELPSEYTNYSGGARGADALWDLIGRRFGVVNHKHLKAGSASALAGSLKNVTSTEVNETEMAHAREEIKKLLGKDLVPGTNDDYIARDYLLVENADAIYAVAPLSDNKKGVKGGTNYAVLIGIKMNKPVYIWDTNTKTWNTYSNNLFTQTDTPTLTKKFAGIGTRDIEQYKKPDAEGKFTISNNYLGDDVRNAASKAIEEVYEKTLNNSKLQNENNNDDLDLSWVEDAVKDPLPTDDLGDVSILDMNTEDPVIETKELKENKEELSEDDLPMIGVDNLQVNRESPAAKLSRDMSAIERHDRVVMIARQFSDLVSTKLEELIEETEEAINKEMAKDKPNMEEVSRLSDKLSTYRDEDKGRKVAIQDTTLEVLFKEMLDEYKEYTEIPIEELDEDYNGNGQHIHDAYQKVVDNFLLLLDEACVTIEQVESIRIITNEHTYNNGIEDKEVIGANIALSVLELDVEENSFEDDEDGNRADGNGGWSYKVRFVDPRTSLSKKVKRVLGNLTKVGLDGKLETDDLGNIRYINSEYAHAVLINDLSNMIDADDWCDKIDASFDLKINDGAFRLYALEKIAMRYPWVKLIINLLLEDPNLISAFYADFRKDFINYWMLKEGKTIPLNLPVAYDSTMNIIIRNYDQKNKLDVDSIYAPGINIDKQNANKGVDIVNNLINDFRDLSEDDYLSEENYLDITKNMSKGLKMLGVEVNEIDISSLLKSKEGRKDIWDTLQAMNDIFKGVVDTKDNDMHLVDAFRDLYRTIAKKLGTVSELENVQSFRDGDKTRYSYSAPNYVDTMFKTIKNKDRKSAYIQREFGRYEWFKKGGVSWRNEWLRLIDEDEDGVITDNLEMKELINIEGVDYKDWDPTTIKTAFIREYFSVGKNKGSKTQFAWYNFPIFSDSPVVKFIKFVRYTENFKELLLPLFNLLVKLELYRINLVEQRKAKGVNEITNFDKNGAKFNFIPKLNRNNGEFLQTARLLISLGDSEGLNTLINDNIIAIMNENFEEFKVANFTEDSSEELINSLIELDAIKNEDEINNALEEYFWNQCFATSLIILLMTTDLAYYKDGTDFLKRFKEVYAAGIKLNTNSKYGKKTERTIYISDLIVTSADFSSIEAVINKAVDDGYILSFDKDNILNKFRDINVADALAYRSLKSFRSVLDMMGAWTNEMEQAMTRIEAGEWNMADFNVVWQTIKPFVFTNIEKRDGLGGIMRVPHLNKNSEFLLLSMYLIIANSTNKSAKLRAINKFMDENDIDVILFESAVKAGKLGVIDINYSLKQLNKLIENNPKIKLAIINKRLLNAKEGITEEQIEAIRNTEVSYSEFKEYLDNKLGRSITLEEYNDYMEKIEPYEDYVKNILEQYSKQNGEFNPDVVHEIPYSDYVVLQPTPEHLFDVSAVFGSLFRNLILSDMPDDPNFRVHINGKDLTKLLVIDLYNSLVVENLIEDYNKLSGRFNNIESLQKAMMELIKGNPKYGRDMINALQIVEIQNPLNPNKTEKVFNIPLNNPTTTTKIQELVDAMFKNAVTKLHIKGGACILVSDFGLTDELHILFKDKYGNQINKDWFNKNSKRKNLEGTYEEWAKATLEKGDISIAGIECYLPASSKKFYAPFLVTKTDSLGNEYLELDINKLPKELRKLIGYRIPTEDKYSMAPLIVKGFLPQLNGSAIMLASEITLIAGSDFDVDKMFLMIPEFRMIEYDMAKARYEYSRTLNLSMEEVFKDIKDSSLAKDILALDPPAFKEWFNLNKNNESLELKLDEPIIEKVRYNMDKTPAEHNRALRNNMLIDIAYGILTNHDTANKILNPGNFDAAKKAARIALITKDGKLLKAYEDFLNLNLLTKVTPEEISKKLLDSDLDTLDRFVKNFAEERDPLSVDTFIYYHKLNMTGGALIGVYANNTTMLAKFLNTSLAIKDKYSFTINGKKIQSLHDAYIRTKDGKLLRISKNCAVFSAASVDNVKDPVLAELLLNMKTAYITGLMLRAGMSVEEIGLMFTLPLIRKCIKDTGELKSNDLRANILILLEHLTELGIDSVNQDVTSYTHITSLLLMDNIVLHQYYKNENNKATLDPLKLSKMIKNNIETALLMLQIIKIADDLRPSILISRADSPNGSIKRNIAGAKNLIHAVRLYELKALDPNFSLVGTEDILLNNFITPNMNKEEMREKLLSVKMPMLQAFYSLGIDLGLKLMAPYFTLTSPYADNLVELLYFNSPYGSLKESQIETLYNDLVTFALTNTKLFGDDSKKTLKEKKDYYIYDYPTKFLKVVQKNKDIANLGIILKMSVINGKIVMKRSGRLTSTMKETLMRDFDTLLYMDNPEALLLAVDLFSYAFYQEKFKFGPNSFGNFFSSTFINSFPEFIQTLREMLFNINDSKYSDFLNLFYANHFEEGFVPTIPSVSLYDAKNKAVTLKLKECLNNNSSTMEPYLYIKFNNLLYKLSSNSSLEAYYKEAPMMDIDLGDINYNINKTAEELSKEVLDKDRLEKSKLLNASISKVKGNNRNDEDVEDYLNAIEGAYDFDPFLNLEGNLEDIVDADPYPEEEGNALLDNELCK